MHALIVALIVFAIIFGGYRLIDYWHNHPKDNGNDNGQDSGESREQRQ